MFSTTKLNPFTPAQINGNNHNNPFRSRRTQECAPTAPAIAPSTSFRQAINVIGGASASSFPPPQPRSHNNATIPGLRPNAWHNTPPSSSSSSSRRPAHGTSRTSTNPYQTFDAKGRKKLHKIRQKISRAVEDKGLIPFALHLVDIQSKSVARAFAEAVNRKAEKLKQKIVPRTLYRGPKLNWMEIEALKRRTDEEEGKVVADKSETGVSNVSEILKQNCWQRSHNVPQVIMPGVHKQSDGEINDGDTDPGTDTDVEEDKENVDPGEGVEAAHTQAADHDEGLMTFSPARPPEPSTPIPTRDPSAHRTTVVEVHDEELPEAPIPVCTQTPSAPENVRGAPQKANSLGEHMFPTVHKWNDSLTSDSVVGGPCVMASQALKNAQTPLSPTANESQPAFRVGRESQESQFSLSGANAHCTSQRQQGQQANDLSKNVFSTSNDQKQQTTTQETQWSFTSTGIPINSEPLHTSFPPSSERHIPTGSFYSTFSAVPDAQLTTQPQTSQFPVSSAQPVMQQLPLPSSGNAASPAGHLQPPSSYHSTSDQPTLQQSLPYSNAAPVSNPVQEPVALPAAMATNSFGNAEIRSQDTFSQPAFGFAQMNHNSAFPPLHATFRFLSATLPHSQPASSQRIIRRLPVLAPDEPPNRPILFGPHGIQAFLKEKPIPTDDPTPSADPSEIAVDFDVKAWNAKRKRLLEEFEEKKRKRPGPLGYKNLPAQCKRGYVGRPPKGSEEDLIRRLEQERRFNKLKAQKRVRFLLPDEPPRKKRRTEGTETPSTFSPKKLESNPRQTESEADPAMPGAYNMQLDLNLTSKVTKQRQFPGITSFFSFLLGR